VADLGGQFRGLKNVSPPVWSQLEMIPGFLASLFNFLIGFLIPLCLCHLCTNAPPPRAPETGCQKGPKGAKRCQKGPPGLRHPKSDPVKYASPRSETVKFWMLYQLFTTIDLGPGKESKVAFDF